MSDPATIYSFRKNPTEEVRVSLRKYEGRYCFDLRVFEEKPSGFCEFVPTKKGVCLDAYIFPEFKRAVEKLEAAMLEAGLLDPEDL